MLTQQQLKNLFEYQDGNLIWKISKGKRGKIGSIAGTITSNGYLSIRVDKKNYKAHRLVYLYHHGYLPNIIDHIDRDKLNNKIENLREATISQNNVNTKIRKDNASGLKGVTWHKASNKWCAQIMVNCKQNHIGLFLDIEDARAAYLQARRKYFGEFA